MPTQAQLSMMQLSICFNLDLMLGILGTVLEGNSCRRQWHHRKITKNISLLLVGLEKKFSEQFWIRSESCFDYFQTKVLTTDLCSCQ